MLRPPSTAMICPVTYGASATRKCTARAMSSGSPTRLSEVWAMMRSRSASFDHTSSSGQMMAPGATPFTRTSGPSSRASDRVSATSPPFAVLYTTWSFIGRSAWISTMLTMHPPALRSSTAAAWDRKSGALRLVPMRSSHAFSVISPTGVGKKLDALLMSTSSRPKRATVSSTSRGRESMCRRSAGVSAHEPAPKGSSSSRNASASDRDER